MVYNSRVKTNKCRFFVTCTDSENAFTVTQNSIDIVNRIARFGIVILKNWSVVLQLIIRKIILSWNITSLLISF